MEMSVADALRTRAERLLALALKARARSDGKDAEELEQLAATALTDADLAERENGCSAPRGPARQQQQPQTCDQAEHVRSDGAFDLGRAEKKLDGAKLRQESGQ